MEKRTLRYEAQSDTSFVSEDLEGKVKYTVTILFLFCIADTF